MTNRDAAYAALYARLKDSLQGIKYATREYLEPTQMPATPALMVTASAQEPEHNGPGLPKWTLLAVVTIIHKPAPGTHPDSILNGYVDQVEQALRPVPGEPTRNGMQMTTLGGVVQFAQITGPIQFFQGLGGGVSAVIIPVEMLAT